MSVVGDLESGIKSLKTVLKTMATGKKGLIIVNGKYDLVTVPFNDTSKDLREAKTFGFMWSNFEGSIYDNKHEQERIVASVYKSPRLKKDFVLGSEQIMHLYDSILEFDSEQFFLMYDGKTDEFYLVINHKNYND